MRPVVVGVSLKMYLGHAEAQRWCARVAAEVAVHPAVADGRVRCFVVPTYLQVLPALATFGDTPVVVGAQDLGTEDAGAFTGEVSGAELVEVGVGVVEVGHAERRALFGEDEDVVAAKLVAALRNGLTPVLCLGEPARGPAGAAADDVVGQLRRCLDGAPSGAVVVAYEPVWAIGAEQPAPPDHVATVAVALRAALDEAPGRRGSSVIYGGSAGPGLLTGLGDAVDGLFLGRFAHDVAALHAVVDEAAALADARAAHGAPDGSVGRGAGS